MKEGYGGGYGARGVKEGDGDGGYGVKEGLREGYGVKEGYGVEGDGANAYGARVPPRTHRDKTPPDAYGAKGSADAYGAKAAPRPHRDETSPDAYGAKMPPRPHRAGGEVEVLLGAVRDEGSYFLVYGVPGFGKDNESLISREEFLGGVRMGVPQATELAAEAVVLHYTDWLDADNPVKNREALDDIVGDHNVVCPLMAFAQRWAQRGGKVYAYLFDHRSSTLLWPSWMGVPHGYEIEFVFGLPLEPRNNYTREEVELSRRIMRYWGNFARTGDPNGGVGGPRWPPYTPSGQRYAHLNARPLSVGHGLRTQICAFWTRFLPKLLNATGPPEDAEREWRLEFHRWSSYMGRWRTQFEHYSRQQPCATL